jgi:hypothetical protein
VGKLKEGQLILRDWNEILMFEDVLMHAKFARASKINGDIWSHNPFHFPNAVINWMRTVVYKLSGTQVLALTGAAMECRYDRKEVEAI